MITTVTLNAAIDKTFYLGHFKIGSVSRAKGGSNGRFIKSELYKFGMIVLYEGKLFRIKAPKINVVNTVGCGANGFQW